MAQNIGNQEPEAPSASLPARTLRNDGWTVDKQIGFLRALAATQNVRAAARSVGMGRQSAYKLRTRLDDAPFGAAWRLATRQGHSALLDAALTRAINGVEIPHYWQGELIGTSRRYDERLTALLLTSGLLEHARPVRDSVEHEFAATGLARLIERIEQGPAHWRDPLEERNFAWSDDPRKPESDPDLEPEPETEPETETETETGFAQDPDGFGGQATPSDAAASNELSRAAQDAIEPELQPTPDPYMSRSAFGSACAQSDAREQPRALKQAAEPDEDPTRKLGPRIR